MMVYRSTDIEIRAGGVLGKSVPYVPLARLGSPFPTRRHGEDMGAALSRRIVLWQSTRIKLARPS